MTGEGGLVEVQATAERTPLSRAHLDELLALAADGIAAAARRAGAGDRRAAATLESARLLLATHNEHKRREFARLLRRPTRVGLLPEDVRAAARGRRDVRRERARQGSCGGRAPPARSASPTTPGSRRPRSAAPRGALRPLRRRARQRRGEPAKLLREAPVGGALRYVCALAYVDPAGGDRAGLRRALRGRAGRASRGRARLWL